MSKLATTAQVRPAAEAQVQGAVRWAIPYEYRFIANDGTVHTAKLVAELASGGLRLRPPADVFRGELFVALEDIADQHRVNALPAPATVLVSAPVDVVEPKLFALQSTGQWMSVGMSVSRPSGNFIAKIRGAADPDWLEINVPVYRPALHVEVQPSHIQGFGLDTAQISVSAPEVPNPEGREVFLRSDGRLSTTKVMLDSAGFGQTTLRSEGVQRTRVTANSPQLESGASTEVQFDWPWPFLLSALLGGCAGGFIRTMQGDRRPRKGKALVRVLLTGAVVGLVTAVLYAVGINLLPVAPKALAGEALVFGVSALGAFLGLVVPQRLNETR